MNARTSTRPTAAAALIYWLMVMCGLAALSVMRASTPREYVPLWIGSVAGVALGQLLGWLRLRVWLITVMSIVTLAVSPLAFAILYALCGSFDFGIDTCLLAFVPAAVCGYLSLSERAGLIAFWYPAMLWMVVILDRPSAGAFDTQKALPLLAGLGVLFVAFLRSRETRRTAIWSTYGTPRLAEPLTRTVLRSSPFRSASQHVWTGLVGALALVLAAWVAPHLWQKESAEHAHAVAAEPRAETPTDAETAGFGERCCSGEDLAEERRGRVREYFPLKHGVDGDDRRMSRAPCTQCKSGRQPRIASGGATAGYAGAARARGHGKDYSTLGEYWAGDTTPAPAVLAGNGGGGYDAAGYGTGGYGYGAPGYDTSGVAAQPTVAPEIPAEPLPYVAPLPAVTKAQHPARPVPLPAKVDVATPPPVVAVAADAPALPISAQSPSRPAVVVLVPRPAAPPPDGRAPWRSVLALCAAGVAMHLASRVARRHLTLRHLARPFWRETLDQRVSNHWQRMLIGLRDAGIHPKSDEQPQALAKRVGIDGMSTCATILERVRHGVRVDGSDLDAMGAAATAVYGAARAKAGAAARIAALVRSPL